MGFQAARLVERQLSMCRDHVDDAFRETSAATGLDADNLTRACGALTPGVHYLDPRLNLTSSSPSLDPVQHPEGWRS